MNIFTKGLMTVTLMISVSSAFAVDDECPSVYFLRSHVRFIGAYKHERQPWVWTLVSSKFEYNQQEWNLFYTTLLPDDKNPITAVEHGQRHFESYESLLDPESLLSSTPVCRYSRIGDPFGIFAYSPPRYPD